jgi:hypothetical protein
VVVPALTPDTTPVEDPIVATDVLLLVQVPPPVALLNAVVPPTHTVVVPVIGVIGFTVIVLVAVAVIPQASVTVAV